MIFDRLLRRREENGQVGKEVDQKEQEVIPEDMQEFKLRMFGLMLQVIYNQTTVLKAVLHGDDYLIHGDPVTSAIIDGDLIINTLKHMGLYARFTMKEFDDGTRGLKWLRKSIVNGLREEFYDMEDIRDGKIFMLDEKIASLQNKLDSATRTVTSLLQNNSAMKTKYNRAHTVFEKMKYSVKEALEHLKHLSHTRDPQEISESANACVTSLTRAISYTIPDRYPVEENTNANKTSTTVGHDDGGAKRAEPSPEEAEKAVEDYYNSQLPGSQGTEGQPEHIIEGQELQAGDCGGEEAY